MSIIYDIPNPFYEFFSSFSFNPLIMKEKEGGEEFNCTVKEFVTKVDRSFETVIFSLLFDFL